MTVGKLSLKVKLGYGVCDLGGNLFFTVIAFMLPIFLTDTVGLGAGLAGTALMVGKIWDGVTDPTVGYLSDHTRTRFGRRRPWMLAGSVPLFLGMWLMFTRIPWQSQSATFAWTVFAFCLLCTAYTMVNIPYSALTPELTRDFDERTVLNGYRMSFAVVGSLLGAGAAQPLVAAFPDEALGFSMMGAIFGAIMMVTALTTFFTAKEPPLPTPSQERPRAPILPTYLAALQNRPFLFLLLGWTLHTMGITILAGSVTYFFKYIFHAEEQATFALLALLVTALLFIPVWVRLSRRWGKRACSVAGMALLAAVLLALFFLAPRYGLAAFLPLMVLAGIGLSTQYVFPYASVPDTVEWDYAETGERKGGIYYGIWNFAVKIGQAGAGMLIGGVLAAAHYLPDVTQTPETLLGIRLLMGPIPMAFYLAGAATMLFYPITRQRFEEVMVRVRQRDAALNG